MISDITGEIWSSLSFFKCIFSCIFNMLLSLFAAYKMVYRRFQNKYRIDTWRHSNWDYSRNGVYFITICTKNRKKYFGEIKISSGKDKNPIIQLSQLGKIAHKYWQDISIHFPFVLTDAFVIMPDHMHGILILRNPNVGAQNIFDIPNCLIYIYISKPNHNG